MAKKVKDTPLEEMTKDELIEKVGKLEKHVQQLKNIIAKQGQADPKVFKHDRKFDFNKYNTRHIALKILYLGWDYNGYVVQEDTNKTIEVALFDALTRAKLIESRETSNYHRCGRTDKGVSAFCQVVSIDVRSNLEDGPGVKIRENSLIHERGGDKTKEIDYVHVLNALLPDEIRAIAWAPVKETFSARFDCNQRMYKYFFPRGALDIGAMKDAGKKLIGHHDFRNFCKMDVQNGVTVYMRHVNVVEISQVNVTDTESPYDMFALTIKGNAFLWHQIRCIMAVLHLIGQGREDVSLIDQLLDVKNNPRKPQYALASEWPLVLFDCSFEDVEWCYDEEDLSDLIGDMHGQWTKHSIRATMVRQMLHCLETENKTLVRKMNSEKSESRETLRYQADSLLVENKCKVYKKLMDRNKCESLEERMAYFVKRRKIEPETSTRDGAGDGPMDVPESS